MFKVFFFGGGGYTSWMYSKHNDHWHILTMKTRLYVTVGERLFTNCANCFQSATSTVKVARTKKQPPKKIPLQHVSKKQDDLSVLGQQQEELSLTCKSKYAYTAGTHKRTQTSPCMGPLHTTLPNFNISSAQQRRSSERGGKPSVK